MEAFIKNHIYTDDQSMACESNPNSGWWLALWIVVGALIDVAIYGWIA